MLWYRSWPYLFLALPGSVWLFTQKFLQAIRAPGVNWTLQARSLPPALRQYLGPVAPEISSRANGSELTRALYARSASRIKLIPQSPICDGAGPIGSPLWALCDHPAVLPHVERCVPCMRAVRLAFSPARNNARSTGIASSGFLLTSLFLAADSTRAARFARLAGLLFARLLFMGPFLSAAAVDSSCRRSPMRQPRGDSGSESSANFRAKRLRTSAAGTLCPPCRTLDRIRSTASRADLKGKFGPGFYE